MSNEIYTGFWINRDKPAIVGATWTLSVTHATIITNLLSVLISTFVVDSLFRILVLFLYSAKPLAPYPLGLVGKVYVSLRNSESARLPRLELLKSILSPQHRGRPRVTALLLFTPCMLLLCLKIGSIAIPALIISGSVDDVALLKPETCGFKVDDASNKDFNFVRSMNELRETDESRKYATERYDKSAPAFTSRIGFPVDALPFSVRHNVSCPFDDSYCLLDYATEFDTGLLDSHQHLGINAPSKDRVQYRWRSTCIPLSVRDHVRILSDTVYDGITISKDEPVYEVNLGTRPAFQRNYTFFYKQNFLDASGYDVRTVSAMSRQPRKPSWDPIEGLSPKDADTTLTFIGTNSILYVNKVYDPVFQATGQLTNGDINNLWSSDYYFRIIGCNDQHQFCNPVTGQCSALNSTFGDWSSPFVNDGISAQYATGMRIAQYAQSHSIDANVRSLGKTALLAQSAVPDHSYVSLGLPSNQWELEAQRWFETGLAKFQLNAMEYANVSYADMHGVAATRNTGISLAQNFSVSYEINSLLSSQCEQQRVKLNGRGQNVSVLGFGIILAATIALFLCSALFSFWAGRRPPSSGLQQRWQQDDLLEIWRMTQGDHPETRELL